MKTISFLKRINWDGLLDALAFASIIPIGGVLIIACHYIGEWLR